jgi:hypothetical protein
MSREDDDKGEIEIGAVFPGGTLEEAQAFVQLHLANGAKCPACGQFAKLYRRKLNATMAYALVLIHQFFKKNPQHAWIHVASFLVNTRRDSSVAGGDVVKLRHWGLIERVDGERGDGSDRVGRYTITELGRRFVEGAIAVPRYAYLFNQMLMRLSEEKTTIQEALGDRFSYEELLQGA